MLLVLANHNVSLVYFSISTRKVVCFPSILFYYIIYGYFAWLCLNFNYLTTFDFFSFSIFLGFFLVCFHLLGKFVYFNINFCSFVILLFVLNLWNSCFGSNFPFFSFSFSLKAKFDLDLLARLVQKLCLFVGLLTALVMLILICYLLLYFVIGLCW